MVYCPEKSYYERLEYAKMYIETLKSLKSFEKSRNVNNQSIKDVFLKDFFKVNIMLKDFFTY